MADKLPSGLPRASATFETIQMPPVNSISDPSSTSSALPPSSIPFSSFNSFRPHNPQPTMASQSQTQTPPAYNPIASAPAIKETNKLDISNLMSPPDPPLDSFTPDTYSKRNVAIGGDYGKAPPAPAPYVVQPVLAMKQPLPMSPPVSPYSKPVITPSDAARSPAGHINRDPVLYPAEEDPTPSPPQPPLFAVAESEDHRRIVDDHLRTRPADIFTKVAPPKREDYVLVLTFRSQVMSLVQKDRNRWLRKERAFLEADKRAGAQRYHAIMPAKPIAAKPPRTNRTDRVSKPTGHIGTLSTAPRPIRSNGHGVMPGKRSVSHTSPTPEPTRRAVAPNREDKDFNSLPDYCPPIDTLPPRANSLKVEWKGQPIDLSGDPHAKLLHPDEVTLAGNLRLDCATYLTSKRRIFERRLHCLRTGKEFRKTDAQQACKIDVNKASKLWTAFDKVGWLKAHWVKPYLFA